MKASSPVIVVGAGRSGTTLLDAMLDEHPSLYMIGETSFLLQRLWQTFFEKPTYVNNQRYIRLCQQARPEWQEMVMHEFARKHIIDDFHKLGKIFDEVEARENDRIAQVIGQSFAELLVPPSLRTHRWGFREIWMGSDAFPYTWELYKKAFPGAQYLHCIRHPITYLRSVLNKNGIMGDREVAIHGLQQWKGMVEYSRGLRSGERYHEFRYEDLIEGEATLREILSFLELPFEPRCLEAKGYRYVPSSGSNAFDDVANDLVRAVPGLKDLMDELGYRLSQPLGYDPPNHQTALQVRQDSRDTTHARLLAL